MTSAKSFGRVLALLAVVAMTGACGTRHSLALYDFSGRTLAVVNDMPAYPELLTGPLIVSSRSPAEALLDIAVRGAREVQTGAVEEKLDSASARVDVAGTIEAEALRRASRYLGTEPWDPPAEADFVLEIFVDRFGIEAADWDATAYFFLEGEATLIDRISNLEVWRTRIGARDPVGPEVFGAPGAARGVVTAALIAGLSVDDMERALDQLADYAAGQITDRLRDDLAESRRRR